MWGNEPSHPQGVPLWELESRWTPESLKDDCRGQTSMAWGVPYIIGNILEHRCLKWAYITHFDIWNISYGQKKGRESNWRFHSWPLKVKNQPNFIKVVGVPTLAILGLSLGSLGTKSHLDVSLMERRKVYYKREGGGFPQVRAVVSLMSPNCPWLILAPKVLQLCINHFVLVLCRPV
jgi:hypothetical protein